MTKKYIVDAVVNKFIHVSVTAESDEEAVEKAEELIAEGNYTLDDERTDIGAAYEEKNP